MATIKTTGIIISENNMGDYDKMVTILTPNIGKIGCAARGSRRPKSQLMAGTQFLSFSNFVLYSSPTSYNINSCDTIEIFYNIRNDLNKLSYASYISKIIYDVTDENQYTYKILQLFLNTLYMISETDKNLDFILAIFKLKLLEFLGFTPNLNKCTHCNTQDNIGYFSIFYDGFLCNSCGKFEKSSINITYDTFNALKYIYSSNSKKVFSFTVSQESQAELTLISNLYLNEKLEKNYQLIKY